LPPPDCKIAIQLLCF